MDFLQRFWFSAVLPHTAGTQAMVERLRRVNQQADPTKNLFISHRRVEMLRHKLPQAKGLTEILSLQTTLARELLVANKPAQAIQMLEQVRKTICEHNLDLTDSALADLLDLKAICYFRLGEVQNCIARHGVDSRLFPIQGGGVHLDTQALHKNPTDLSSRWLLNLAYMTLGRHPKRRTPPIATQQSPERQPAGGNAEQGRSVTRPAGSASESTLLTARALTYRIGFQHAGTTHSPAPPARHLPISKNRVQCRLGRCALSEAAMRGSNPPRSIEPVSGIKEVFHVHQFLH